MREIAPADRKRLADLIGKSEQYLYQCLTGRRDMDPGEAMTAETVTNGELKRQMLCQRSYRTVWPSLPPLADCANDAGKQAA